MSEFILWFCVITAYVLSTYMAYKVAVMQLEINLIKQRLEQNDALIERVIDWLPDYEP